MNKDTVTGIKRLPERLRRGTPITGVARCFAGMASSARHRLKGAQICYAHAGQLAMAVRRERERRAVLAEAVAEMRRRGRPECEMADLLTDFKGIQLTLAVMARALIDGSIDCKTAGQMVVHLQTLSKLLWQIHGETKSTTEARRRGEKPGLPPIFADDRRLKPENWAAKSCVQPVSDFGSARILLFDVMAFGDRSRAHGPPEWKAA